MNRKLKLWELERPSVEEYKDVQRFPVTLVLDNIRSLNNVGTFFRTADAFNIAEIILCGITACPPHREIQKTALGATDSVKWRYVENIMDVITELKEKNIEICSIEQAEQTTKLHEMTISNDKKYAIIMGNEVDGVQQAVINQSHHVVEIPQFGTKHSLNVAVCAGVVLWDFVKPFISKV